MLNKKSPGARAHSPETPARPVRVLVVDDHPLMRKAVRATIDAQPDMASCGEAASRNEALEKIEKTGAELAVVDISMPGGDGIDLIRDLKARRSTLLVLVFSMHDEMLYAERAIRAGASGYVMKQDPPERLVLGLRTVLKGELFVSQRLASSLLNVFMGGGRRPRARTGMESLSDRELQIFVAIGGGLSTSGIAEKLGISPKTVDTYRSHIKRKLGLKNANELVHAAVRWVESEASSGPNAST
jgi:DNA-binding NarL/FixJ family response regulator